MNGKKIQPKDLVALGWVGGYGEGGLTTILGQEALAALFRLYKIMKFVFVIFNIADSTLLAIPDVTTQC